MPIRKFYWAGSSGATAFDTKYGLLTVKPVLSFSYDSINYSNGEVNQLTLGAVTRAMTSPEIVEVEAVALSLSTLTGWYPGEDEDAAIHALYNRQKLEVEWRSLVGVTIGATPLNLINWLKNLAAPAVGTLSGPFVDLTNDKITVLNKDRNVFIKVLLEGSFAGGSASRGIELSFSSGGGPQLWRVDRDEAAGSDITNFLVMFSVDKDGFLATNGTTATISRYGENYNVTRILLVISQ